MPTRLLASFVASPTTPVPPSLRMVPSSVRRIVTRYAASLVLTALVVSRAAAQTNAFIASPDEKTTVSVFLDGSIKAAAAKADETSVATGALGIQFGNRYRRVSALLNIAAKRDTIRASPGQSLLAPGTGGFTAGLAEVQLRITDDQNRAKVFKPFEDRLSVRGYMGVSSVLWELPADGATATEAVNANAVGWGLGASLEALDGRIGSDAKAPAVSLNFDFGFTQRLLYGDVMEDTFDARREAFLGSPKRRFSGYEIGARVQYNTIRGSLVYYNFPKSRGVRGFTRGQVAAGFAIGAPILEGELRRRGNEQ